MPSPIVSETWFTLQIPGSPAAHVPSDHPADAPGPVLGDGMES